MSDGRTDSSGDPADDLSPEARVRELEEELAEATEAAGRAANVRRRLERDLDRSTQLAQERERALAQSRAELQRLRRRRAVRLVLAGIGAVRGPLRAGRALVSRLGGRGREGTKGTGVAETVAGIGAGAAAGLVARIVASLPPPPLGATGRVSVIVDARTDAVSLARCLAALDATDWDELEILVAGPNADNRVRAATQGDQRSPGGRRRVRPVTGGTAADSRREALAISTGDLVLFMHDDVEPIEPGWLRRMVAALGEEGVGAVGARLLLPAGAGDRARGIKDLTHAHEGIEFIPVSGMPEPRPIGVGGDPLDPTAPTRRERAAASEACLLVARAALDEVGLPPQSPFEAEPVELCLRLRASGRRIVVEGGAVLWHRFPLREATVAAELDPGESNDLAARWGPALYRTVLLDRLAGLGRWSSMPLRVGIVLAGGGRAAGDELAAGRGLGGALEGLGWSVSYLEGEGRGWYDGTDRFDVLVSLADRFDLFGIPRNPIAIAWIRGAAAEWTARPWFDNYDLVLASSDETRADVERVSAKRASVLSDPGELRALLTDWAMARRIAAHIGPLTWERGRTWGDVPFGRDIQRQLERRGHPTAVLVHDERTSAAALRADVALHVFGVRAPATIRSQVNALWVISHPDRVTEALCDGYDIVFVASDQLQEHLAGRVDVPVVPLHQATEPARFYPDPTGPRHQLLFVGSSRGVQRPIIEDLRGTSWDLAVYGGGWAPEMLDPKHHRGAWVPNDELRRYYSSADIVLNDHWGDMRDFGIISNRVYDALACGAFVVSDSVPGIEAEFDGAVATYETREQLLAVIERFLADPEARAAAAAKGRAAVLERHTFAIRATRLLAELEPLIAGRPAVVATGGMTK